MSGKIFINYRRGDEPGFTGWLRTRLEDNFTPDQIFTDIDSIEPGSDFVRVLEDQINHCDVILVVIGPRWLEVRDEAGRLRLENANDFVRIEIESGLRLGKRIIPVLVNDAAMPREEQLPDTLKALARRHAVRLTHERFKADAQGLVGKLEKALRDVAAARQTAQPLAAEAKRQKEMEQAKAATARRPADEQTPAEAALPTAESTPEAGLGRLAIWLVLSAAALTLAFAYYAYNFGHVGP